MVSLRYSNQVFPDGHWWYHLVHQLSCQILYFVLNFISHLATEAKITIVI